MEAIDAKKMTCCENEIPPRVSTRQKPYIVSWKCPKCGRKVIQIIEGNNLLVFDIAESINTIFAIPDCLNGPI